MIELRWFKMSGPAPEYGVNAGKEVKVLQYRQQEEDWRGQNETPDLAWSEWADVPEVEQE